MGRTSRYESAKPEEKKWKVGFYLRLSKEDLLHINGDSIESQELLARQSIEKFNDLELVKIYTDNGYTGGNFDRPEYKIMLEDIRHKIINCVVVKDLSRFGRDDYFTSRYVQYMFPYLGVRFIAINDNIDSYLKPDSIMNLETMIKMTMNNQFLLDTSIKVKKALLERKRKGYFTSSYAPYGYEKDALDHHKFVIDEDVKDIIKLIFDLYLKGFSQCAIARHLNEIKVLPPSEYKNLKYKKTNTEKEKNCCMWNASEIKRILTNEVYIGNMVQCKSKKVFYKSKKVQLNDKDDWVRVENTHPAIIDKEKFEVVQKLLKERSYDNFNHSKNTGNIFRSKIICGDCKYNMTRKKCSNKGKDYFWICSRNFRNEEVCSTHKIRQSLIEDAIIKIFNQYIKMIVDLNKIEKQYNRKEDDDNYREVLLKKIKSLENENINLYYKFKGEKLNLEAYKYKRDLIEKEIVDCKKILEGEEEAGQKKEKQNETIKKILSYKNIKSIEKNFVENIIDKIYVFENKKIEIKFKFGDEFDEIFKKYILLKNAN